jgi:hypothetical protein
MRLLVKPLQLVASGEEWTIGESSQGQSFQFQFCGGLNSAAANDVVRRKSEI